MSAGIAENAEESEAMNNVNKLQLKTALIELGFWGLDEVGDPTVEWVAAHRLIERMQEQLNPRACLTLKFPANPENGFALGINIEDKKYELAEEQNFCETVCRAAIALQGFLVEHPECWRIHRFYQTQISDLEKIAARLAEIEAIRDVISETLQKAEMQISVAREEFIRLCDHRARNKASEVFARKGGSAADFETFWPGAFAEALELDRACNDQ